jgi:hypothetical protein
MSAAVTLSAQLLVAEGGERSCFRHPLENDCCIKLMQPELGYGRLWRELRYYASLQRRGVEFEHLARCRGLIDTNLGEGVMFDLVLDDDGRVSKSLAYYLAQNDRRCNRWIVAEIEQLKQDLYDQWIVFYDLDPGNILVQRLSYDGYRLVVIGGIGHDHFIPLASYSSAYARRKLVQLWNRCYHQWYAAFPVVARALKPYPAF